MINLQDFITKYTGILCGNTPENQGQCVGLVSLWMDNLGIAHEWGNAKDLLTNADTSKFDVITNNLNDTTQFPIPGDIIVWGDTWGDGLGHTGIITKADGNTFSAFEQNNPGAPQINDHPNYLGVLGWLHPKTVSQVPQTNPLQAELDQMRTDRDNNWNLYQTTLTSLTTAKTTIDNLNQIIKDRNNDISKLNAKASTSDTQVTTLQQQVQILQEQANKVPSLATELEQAKGDRDACLKAEDQQQAKIKELQTLVNLIRSKSFFAKLSFLFS